MTKTAPEAPQENVTEVWHVDFHMSYEPGSLSPAYINVQVSRREPGAGEPAWHYDGIASFDAPSIVLPRAGAPLIPYLVYHLNTFREWLTTEHVLRELNGATEVISEDVGLSTKPPGTEPVYVP